ncbi:unnamed protein product [Didymodactylos carnosus]|uniref:Uncharacterized protein n=2 Tax=Didymodactylos carnosus TaxID=1234261 RepID=A0A814B4H3_9BILA|nr:unnamed protein product [Didymodactylos carnosus]CAF3703197.1 unnamed protein product [Didymodactylos carnosus]
MMWSLFLILLYSWLFRCVNPEVPQVIDYLNGFHLDCYECHSNRPGCGKKLNWLLMRWKRCDMPGGAKCVKIIERTPDGETNYIRGCLREIEATRPEMPTVRENGCWTATDNYVGLGYNIYIPTTETIYCFCNERDGCLIVIKFSLLLL